MTHQERIARLREQGVEIPFPETVAIAEDVNLGAISGPKTLIHPGCHLAGEKLQISPGCTLGAEGPVTLKNCALGQGVALKAGFFDGAVFLERSNMALGAHIRPGTLLEEEANGAHTVGLKQTILLPFVTLGSLINFCDILMAGGSSRQDHSEVGSSFIHFNFTPHGQRGDKATASLIGDIPRGVMLRSKRIFLGGQAGLVGPVSVDYGTVLAAGAVYRRDYGPGQLVVGEPLSPVVLPFTPLKLGKVAQRVERNLRYIGNLAALWRWYEDVRLPHAHGDPQRKSVYQAAQLLVEGAVSERIKQLSRFASYMDDSIAILETAERARPQELAAQRAFAAHWPAMEHDLGDFRAIPENTDAKAALLRGIDRAAKADYIETIYGLPAEATDSGTTWLQGIVDHLVNTQMSRIAQ